MSKHWRKHLKNTAHSIQQWHTRNRWQVTNHCSVPVLYDVEATTTYSWHVVQNAVSALSVSVSYSHHTHHFSLQHKQYTAESLISFAACKKTKTRSSATTERLNKHAILVKIWSTVAQLQPWINANTCNRWTRRWSLKLIGTVTIQLPLFAFCSTGNKVSILFHLQDISYFPTLKRSHDTTPLLLP